MPTGAFKVIVFDAVGTLIYPEPSVATVYASVGRRFGSRRTEAVVATRFRDVFRDVERRDRDGDQRTSEHREYARWQEIVRRVLDDVPDHSASFAELFDHFARPDSWRVFDDVPTTLDELAARGVRLAIASNFDRRLFEIARQLKPLDRCNPILVSSQIGYRKPHVRFFEAVASAIAVPVRDVLFVGDDPANDSAGAATAGFRTRLISRTRLTPRDDSISSLTQLLE